jgi:type IV fimbrial biogenesis protein FimT
MRYPSAPGFTLIELVVTVAVAAILLTLGLPSFSDMIRDNRLAGHSNRFLSALNIARSEAIKRGQQVTVCKANTEVPEPYCGGPGWESGWMVFVDKNEDGVVDDNQDIVRVFEALPTGFTLRLPNSNHNIDRWIAYKSTGAARGNGGLATGTFSLCQGSDAIHARSIIINSIGRARIEKGTDSCP